MRELLKLGKIRHFRCFCDDDAAHLELEFVPAWSQRALTLQPGSRTPTRPYQVSVGFAGAEPRVCKPLSLQSAPAGPKTTLLRGKSVCTRVLPFLSVWSLLHPYPNCIPGIPAPGWLLKCLEQAGVSPAQTLPPGMQISSFCIPEKGTESFRACFSSPCPLV